jgi:hypothetical protein
LSNFKTNSFQVVASRTRAQIRNLDKITFEGTIPEREIPKYDLDGELAWYINDIAASREADADCGIPSVEFKVSCEPFLRQQYRYASHKITSWEDVTVLNSVDAQGCILDFYEKNPNAYGKQAVLDIWKLRGGDKSRRGQKARRGVKSRRRGDKADREDREQREQRDKEQRTNKHFEQCLESLII